MQKPDTKGLITHIIFFIVAQLAWLTLLGLWIYRTVSSRMLMEEVEGGRTATMTDTMTDIFALVGGIVLFVAVSVGMALIFRRLTVEIRLSQLVDEFVAGITHELKTPLATIQLYLETLRYREVPARESEHFLGLMLEETERLRARIEQLLQASALTPEGVKHRKIYVPAHDALKEIIDDAALARKVDPNMIRFSGGCDGFIHIDPDAMRIVFDNLIDNAIKYSTGPAHISIAFSHKRQRIAVAFKDQGAGIAREDLKTIFDKFRRITRPHLPSVRGTGLGLYWANQIVSYHAGRLRAQSDGVGFGSTFILELPLVKQNEKDWIS